MFNSIYISVQVFSKLKCINLKFYPRLIAGEIPKNYVSYS